jgi:hypothetical protein
VYDTIGFMLMLISGSTAAGGGLGGGELHVPVLILLMQFSLRETIPLSTVVCLGVGAGNVLQMAFKRHPFADRPLIDVWMAGLIGPMMLIGTILGVLLNQMVPNWFVLTLLIIVMSAATLRTLRRGITMWREESSRSSAVASEAELANYQVSYPSCGDVVCIHTRVRTGRRECARIRLGATQRRHAAQTRAIDVVEAPGANRSYQQVEKAAIRQAEGGLSTRWRACVLCEWMCAAPNTRARRRP